MQELSGGRINQPILHNGRFRLAAHGDLEKRVMPGGRAQNGTDLLGIHRQGDRSSLAAIQDCRDFAGLAEPPRFVLAPSRSGRAFHYNLLRILCLGCHGLLPFLTLGSFFKTFRRDW